MRQRLHRETVMPRHILRRDHRIDDGFLRRKDRRGEQRVEMIVIERAQIGDPVFFSERGVRVGGRESEKNIARAVASQRACPRHAKRCAFCDPFELMRQHGRVGGKDDDQRAIFPVWVFAVRPHGMFFQMIPNGRSRDRQLIPRPEIGLRERADGPPAEFFRKFSG